MSIIGLSLPASHDLRLQSIISVKDNKTTLFESYFSWIQQTRRARWRQLSAASVAYGECSGLYNSVSGCHMQIPHNFAANSMTTSLPSSPIADLAQLELVQVNERHQFSCSEANFGVRSGQTILPDVGPHLFRNSCTARLVQVGVSGVPNEEGTRKQITSSESCVLN